MLSEEQRDDLRDLILQKGTIIWADEEELDTFGPGKDLSWWFDTLGHASAHPGCCKACGCCTSCMLSVFYGSVVDTTLRELARIDALRIPPGDQHPTRSSDAT
jgi:hypothetical protein